MRQSSRIPYVARIPRGGLALVLLALLTLAGCGLPGTVATAGQLPPASAAPTATPLPPIQFPQDEAPHHDLTEWYYYTGHFSGTDSSGQTHDYGFELTFFQTLRGNLSPYYPAHFAISDITRGQFHYAQHLATLPLSTIPSPGSTNGFHLNVDGWTTSGLNGHDQLAASMPDYTINLNLTDELPHPILEGGNGLISYGGAGYSYYYSRPLMTVGGTITDHGAQIAVHGQAWFDHQWGDFLSLAGSGWDWYSIQLSNHTEYMLYEIRDSNHQSVSMVGTYVDASGNAHEIPGQDIHSQAIGSWTSPVTGGTYPSGWQVTLTNPNVTLTITPQLKDQELVTTQTTGLAYWEGACSMQGQAEGQSVTGEGYVELTGYASIPASGISTPGL